MILPAVISLHWNQKSNGKFPEHTRGAHASICGVCVSRIMEDTRHHQNSAWYSIYLAFACCALCDLKCLGNGIAATTMVASNSIWHKKYATELCRSPTNRYGDRAVCGRASKIYRVNNKQWRLMISNKIGISCHVRTVITLKSSESIVFTHNMFNVLQSIVIEQMWRDSIRGQNCSGSDQAAASRRIAWTSYAHCLLLKRRLKSAKCSEKSLQTATYFLHSERSRQCDDFQETKHEKKIHIFLAHESVYGIVCAKSMMRYAKNSLGQK